MPKKHYVHRKSRSSGLRTHAHSSLEKKPRLWEESDLLEFLAKKNNPLLLILDQVQDPHNLGACLRTADGAGVSAVIVPKNHSVGITETVQRVACGAAEKIPFCAVTNLVRFLKHLKEQEFWIIGSSDHGQKNLYQQDLTGKTALILGAEGKGMRRLTEESCDDLIKIPMQGHVPCLNISVAAGVLLFEAVRQREVE